ncbi:class I SAM-dependent methyltransferase [Microbacterium sp. CPCC 204701]|uniref:class I SAM-dependent methyltransferase n=1 Tax=Microbacterium sp. CPCC 204701 TaxID=2493084 RepID=UPI001F0C6ABF|nr:class I SAM-dependent methyltransferase [Microbacterium sp. CPCC 204701]
MTGIAAHADAFGRHYERALREPTGPVLLREAAASGGTRHDVDRYLARADALERRMAQGLSGPVLDVGCGPGRMVHAAREAGLAALGVDVSAAAAQIARSRGIPVMQGSVFDALPHEGAWGTTLLLDGSIGIGGDPGALLARCRDLLRADGRVLVETHADSRRDRRFAGVLADESGATGGSFPWAEVGRHALRRYACDARLQAVREWNAEGRWFAEYARTAPVSGDPVARRRAR